MQKTIKIFCCYAHEDASYLAKLKTHLAPLQRQGLINIWSDTNISPGTNWEHEITRELTTAQIILMLISPNFMDSDYCYCKEMRTALERHERGEVCVIPIILRPTFWQIAPFQKIQALPKDGKPLKDWTNQDKGFLQVVEGIHQAIETVRKNASIVAPPPMTKRSNHISLPSHSLPEKTPPPSGSTSIMPKQAPRLSVSSQHPEASSTPRTPPAAPSEPAMQPGIAKQGVPANLPSKSPDASPPIKTNNPASTPPSSFQAGMSDMLQKQKINPVATYSAIFMPVHANPFVSQPGTNPPPFYQHQPAPPQPLPGNQPPALPGAAYPYRKTPSRNTKSVSAKTVMAGALKIVLFFLGSFLTMLGLMGSAIEIAGSNQYLSSVAGGISFTIWIVSFCWSSYIFFKKRYFAYYLKGSYYLKWMGLMTAAVITSFALIYSFVPKPDRILSGTIFGIIFLFYGVSLIVIACRKPSSK